MELFHRGKCLAPGNEDWTGGGCKWTFPSGGCSWTITWMKWGVNYDSITKSEIDHKRHALFCLEVETLRMKKWNIFGVHYWGGYNDCDDVGLYDVHTRPTHV